MPAALVIGARNLGHAIVERLLADGWAVTGAARSPETLAKVRAAGADALEVDVTDQASVLAALGEVADRHGRIDLAVNAASPYGGGRSGPFGGGSLAEAQASGFEALVERLGVRVGAQRAADHEPLDLAGAFEDRVELRVAVPLLDREVLDVAPSPERLDRLLACADGDL
jgi:NAD(P)-dependent dehydrogenase (short-subunit alcohol dehydrogenase family)